MKDLRTTKIVGKPGGYWIETSSNVWRHVNRHGEFVNDLTLNNSKILELVLEKKIKIVAGIEFEKFNSIDSVWMD